MTVKNHDKASGMTTPRLKIGTRASPLALAQANAMRDALTALPIFADYAIELVEFSTKGDRILNQPLAEIGGKGLFTEELTRAIRAGDIDLAVHSLKDLPTADEDGLVIAALPERAATADLLVVNPDLGLRLDGADPLAALPPGALIGTASLRRRAQILRQRPDCEIVSLRGNVGTRLDKMQKQGMAATLLAQAGISRLGLSLSHIVALPNALMLPAAGQGALALQCAATNNDLRSALRLLHHDDTAICVAAERSFLAALEGNCRTPIAASARIVPGGVELHGRILSLDGQEMMERIDTAPRGDAMALGHALAHDIRRQVPHLVAQGN